MKLHLSYHNGSHRGPGAVVTNLLKGLSKTDIEIVADLTKADIVGCLQHPGSGYNKLPKATVMGPNIFVLPDEAPEIWNNFTNFVTPSQWVKDLYQPFNSENKRDLNIWAVGIDTNVWKPDDSVKTLDCFVYYKNRPKEELLQVARFLKIKKLNFKIIEYGAYQESQLKHLCCTSKFVVMLDDTESQGLAVQQIMSMNIPCFVFNKNIWEYKGKEHSATSVPYFSDDCGFVSTLLLGAPTIMRHLDEFINNLNTFKPRKFIEENFNLELKAREYVDILSKAFGK